MNFILFPSLCQFSAVVIARKVLKSRDIIELFTCHMDVISGKRVLLDSGFVDKPTLTLFFDTISAKLESLSEDLQDIVRLTVRGIAFEIGKTYQQFFQRCDKKDIEKFMDRLILTPMGNVDKIKTMETFLEDEDYDLQRRFSWFRRCYCLRPPNSHPKVYLSQPSTCNLTYLSVEENYMRDVIDRHRKQKDRYFCECLTDLLETTTGHVSVTTSEECLTCDRGSVFPRGNNKSPQPCFSFYQFWFNLSSEQRKSIVERISNKKVSWSDCTSEVIFYLASQMGITQQTTFLFINGQRLLLLILDDWNRRELLFPCMQLINGLLPTYDLTDVMVAVAHMGFQDCRNHNFLCFLEMLWHRCLHRTKDQLFRYSWGLVNSFVKLRDERSISLLLTVATDDEKVDIVSMVKELYKRYSSQITIEECDSFDNFVRELN